MDKGGGGGVTCARHDRALTHRGSEGAEVKFVAPTTSVGNFADTCGQFHSQIETRNFLHEIPPAPCTYRLPSWGHTEMSVAKKNACTLSMPIGCPFPPVFSACDVRSRVQIPVQLPWALWD